MRAIASIPAGDLLIIGRLEMTRRKPYLRPALSLHFWSPVDHVYRSVEVPDSFKSDAAVEIEVADPLVPGLSRIAWVAADPGEEAATRTTLSYFADRLRAWRAEQALAGRLVEPARVAVPTAIVRRQWV